MLTYFKTRSNGCTGLTSRSLSPAGHTRRISIPECVEFDITTNACRGFCESWSVPSAWQTLLYNPHQIVTSIGQCCNIMDTEDVRLSSFALSLHDGVQLQGMS